MPKSREISIGLFFLKYFLYIFVGIMLTVLLLTGIFELMLGSGFVYPALYAEEQARLAAEIIQSADQVTEDLIPELCHYAVFDKSGQVLSTDMSERDTEHAWNVVSGKAPNGGSYIGADYYLGIPRGAECCVLQFQLMAQYQSALLRKYLPRPEVLLPLVFFVLVFVVILSVALRFKNVVKHKLSPLVHAADMIQSQELNFDIEHGSVKEINTVLSAMEDMRIALKESLENQWRMEQMKNEQISALAHDLKTPLTLVRGNAELLDDTFLTDEQKEYTAYIMDSALQMQDYVQMMIEIIRNSSTISVNKQPVDAAQFCEELKKQACALCSIHHIRLKWDCAISAKKMCVEPMLFFRALMNIFANAVEHTPDGGMILFEGSEDKEYIVFTISDMGKGFTDSALWHATEQFYMDDDSRTATGSHYGMGLYIVDTIVKQHNGLLILENVSVQGGAKVTVKIPIGAKADKS